MSIFEEGEAERFCAIDEQAATAVLLILNNPIAVAVLANEEEGRPRRGRLVHDTFPFLWRTARQPAYLFVTGCEGTGHATGGANVLTTAYECETERRCIS
jgi:hypothetical protein